MKVALRVAPLAAELRAQGVEMLLVPDYATAQRHAAGLGLVGRGPVAVSS